MVNDAETGGAQTLIEQLALELENTVESHVLVLLGKGSLSNRLVSCTASLTYLDLNRGSIRLDRLIRQTRQVIRAISPDVVHSHLLQADLAAALACVGLEVSTVSTVHTTGMRTVDPLRSRILGKVLGVVSNRLIGKSVACGSSAAGYMRKNGYSPAKLKVIANGVALPSIAPLKSSASADVILSLSRWHPMKDHANLFRALSEAREKNPCLRLVCAGGGMNTENDELMALLNELNVADFVTLLGPVQDVREKLRTVDALVISSSYGEALPMAGLEALAEGVPVITTDVGDCERLTVRPWQFVPPADSTALANAIVRLYELSKAEYREVSHESFDRVAEDYSITSTSRQYLELYREVAGSRVKSGNAI